MCATQIGIDIANEALKAVEDVDAAFFQPLIEAQPLFTAAMRQLLAKS